MEPIAVGISVPLSGHNQAFKICCHEHLVSKISLTIPMGQEFETFLYSRNSNIT